MEFDRGVSCLHRPSITPGWDPSPREFIDLPWGDQGHTACVEKLGHACYVQDPTMDQLTQHTKDAVSFALAHRDNATEANAVIIGAWNEVWAHKVFVR